MQTQATTGVVIPFRRPAHAQGLVKHTARLSWLDREGRQHVERFAAWTLSEATRQGWVRARSLRLSGEASTYRIQHTEQVYV